MKILAFSHFWRVSPVKKSDVVPLCHLHTMQFYAAETLPDVFIFSTAVLLVALYLTTPGYHGGITTPYPSHPSQPIPSTYSTTVLHPSQTCYLLYNMIFGGFEQDFHWILCWRLSVNVSFLPQKMLFRFPSEK